MCVYLCIALFCLHVIVLFILRNQIINYFNISANLSTVDLKIINMLCIELEGTGASCHIISVYFVCWLQVRDFKFHSI